MAEDAPEAVRTLGEHAGIGGHHGLRVVQKVRHQLVGHLHFFALEHGRGNAVQTFEFPQGSHFVCFRDFGVRAEIEDGGDTETPHLFDAGGSSAVGLGGTENEAEADVTAIFGVGGDVVEVVDAFDVDECG